MKTPKTHFVSNRCVFTYQPAGWPDGCLTGYLNRAGGFVLEHVVAFPGAPSDTLIKMVRAGLEEAWAREYPYVMFTLPSNHPRHAGLARLGARCGFVEYATTAWVARRPK
jgi:hypothetical protein